MLKNTSKIKTMQNCAKLALHELLGLQVYNLAGTLYTDSGSYFIPLTIQISERGQVPLVNQSFNADLLFSD